MEKCTELENMPFLTEKQLEYIRSQISKPSSKIVGCHVKPAAEEGIAGFLGDHLRMTLCVKENNLERNIHLFVKTLPMANKPKADFIIENNLFKKEALMFKLIGEIQEMDYAKPWCTKAIIHADNVIVMPDLSAQGYRTHPTEEYFDKQHVHVCAASIARYHAAFANLFRKIYNNSGSNNLPHEYRLFDVEIPFGESPWLRAAAKLTKDILKQFSTKTNSYPEDLEDRVWRLYVKAVRGLKKADDTINVLIHKDLWANNIMFQYSGDAPTNAILVDFQLVQHAPPAYDVMSLLYLTTSRSFRDSYEKDLLNYYYSIFLENLDDHTKNRVKELNYDREAFLAWCERARLFAFVQTTAIFPYVMMDPNTAQKTFDDPDTYMEYLEVDRSAPVTAHARDNVLYRQRLVEVCEEFVEKYVL